jgi:hypothetical protein
MSFVPSQAHLIVLVLFCLPEERKMPPAQIELPTPTVAQVRATGVGLL